MTRVFFDTNVLLDVLRQREPFVRHAQPVWLLAERGKVRGLVSTLSFANIFYIVRRGTDSQTARRTLHLLRAAFTPVACDARLIDLALAADFSDFEDAIQYYSASSAAADCILSRDAEHFQRAAIPVLTPAQFLATYRLD